MKIEHEQHKLVRCEQKDCGQVFCPDCDLPSGAREVVLVKPVLCGMCLERNPIADIRAVIVRLRNEEVLE